MRTRINFAAILVSTAVLSSVCASAPSPQDTPSLILDINDSVRAAYNSDVNARRHSLNRIENQCVRLGGVTFFSATDGKHGHEAWKSDGTTAGTVLLKDINPGSEGSDPDGFLVIGNLLYFAATTAEHGRELWVSDGSSSGTRQVADIQPGPASSSPSAFEEIHNKLMFVADDGVHGSEPWTSNGTTSGTSMLRDIRKGGASSNAGYFFESSATLVFFQANDGNSGSELWSSDGSSAGTKLVRDIHTSGDSSPKYFRRLGSSVLFSATSAAHGNELWKTDGTSSGTTLIRDIYPGSFGGSPFLRAAQTLGGRLFFTAFHPQSVISLWVTDGSTNGTSAVPGFAGVRPIVIRSVGTKLYMTTAEDGIIVTDGSPYNRTTIAQSAGLARELIPFGAGIAFTAARGIYITDGTTTGTKQIATSGASSLTDVGAGHLLFAGTENRTGVELYRYDGTKTALVREINPTVATHHSDPSHCVDIDGIVYFSAYTPTIGRELWRTDSTAAGTRLVKDIWPGRSSAPRDLVRYRNRLYFTASDGVSGRELWVSDGTRTGTKLAIDLVQGAQTSDMRHLTVYRDRLYFSANDGVRGHELWSSDGTQAGTKLVHEFYSGRIDGNPHELYVHEDRLYMAALSRVSNIAYGYEMWVYNGDSATMTLVHDVHPGAGSSYPNSFASLGSLLLFAADDGVVGEELWVTDGTSANTRRLPDIATGAFSRIENLVAGDRLAFAIANNSGILSLWRTDGTPAGTKAIPIPNTMPGTNLFMLGRHVVFPLRNQTTNGVEIWSSDGSIAGTKSLVDLGNKLGVFIGNPLETAVLSHGKIILAVTTGLAGQELHVWSPPFANRQTFGASCGKDRPTLRITSPILGSTSAISGRGASNNPGLLYLNAPGKTKPLAGCSDYVDLASAIFITVVASPSYKSTLTIPNNPALMGVRVSVQGWFVSLPQLLPLQSTNGVLLSVGR